MEEEYSPCGDCNYHGGCNDCLIEIKNKQIEDLRCCGNCGNVFYGVESNDNLTISNKAVKICSASHNLFRDDHVCKHWIYDGKTKEERKG